MKVNPAFFDAARGNRKKRHFGLKSANIGHCPAHAAFLGYNSIAGQGETPWALTLRCRPGLRPKIPARGAAPAGGATPFLRIMKKNTRVSKTYFSPVKLLLVIAASIFVIEAAIMMILPRLPALSEGLEALLDSTILITFLSPILYLFLFRPLLVHITGRRKVEEDLIRERDMAQGYLDVAGVIIVAIDEHANVMLINKKGCEILGYAEGEIVGKNWFSDFVPDDAWWVVKKAVEGLKKETPEHTGYFENPVITKGGQERYILWRYAPLTEEGAAAGVLFSGEDITERKRMEKALIESVTHYRLVHNSAFDGIIVSGEDDRVRDCNPSAEKIFGYEKGELAGTPLAGLMPPRYRKKHEEGLKRFLSTGKSEIQGKALELEGLKKDGTVFPVELILSSFHIEGAVRFTGTIRDITERKRAERDRERMLSQINQSQKIEAVGRLAGGIAHDFNNILTTIEGNAELAMEDAPKSGPVCARLEEITASVKHASKLTRQLLLFSRGQPVELKPLNINSAVENIFVMISRLIGEEIKIDIDLAPGVWTVDADEAGMEQVLLNLAVNARDAMPDGGTLFIKTENAALDEKRGIGCEGLAPGRYVALTVKDTGSGMDPALIPRIFEPFFTTKEEGKGTGLGLSVVYGIIKQHGGCATVESEPGAGTSFTIYLPATGAGLPEETPETGSRRL